MWFMQLSATESLWVVETGKALQAVAVQGEFKSSASKGQKF
jgi:hypothetical protein